MTGSSRFDPAYRNVVFEYPGSQSSKPAIDDLSFSIAPGQLVVIVGANGSGKTSLVKLLTRMYEPTSGTVLVDGQRAQNFKLKDLREVTAMLSQDHRLFKGMSIAENICLGRSSLVDRPDLLDQALKLGGAHAFVNKLERKADTVIYPIRTKTYRNTEDHIALQEIYAKLERSSDVSGTIPFECIEMIALT
jgi:ABC-type multidrug transport system fused ATPase/permease subunit